METNYIFGKPIREVIKSRISIRTYEPTRLENNTKKSLSDYLDGLKSPFKGNVRLKLIDSGAALNNDIKLGTYGVIKGASSFVAAATTKEGMNLEELGYKLECFVLYATSLGIGTCWLGGTFKKGEFAKALELKEDEILPIVTPIGYPANSEGFVGSMMRRIAGSNNRKAWQELFFDGGFNKRLSKSEAGIYEEALEALRLAPSAANKQPWRIVKEGDKLHFYLHHAKGYSEAMDFDMQRIDIGIAMCHLEMTLKEMNITGSWKKLEPNFKPDNGNIEYIISWTI